MTEPIAVTSPALEAAQIAKITAEIASLAAETAKNEAIALKESHLAASQAITLKERERVEQLTLVQDYYVQHHSFDGAVNEKTVYGLLNTMSAWHRSDPTAAWTIDINSPGGQVIPGMHLFDQIVAYSKRGGGDHHITMTVRGHAASMAGILLQAADLRLCGPESYIMVHEVSTWAQGKIGELRDEMKFLEKLSARVAQRFVDRSGGKTSLEEFEELWERKDAWLDSEEALRRGFVDAIG